MKSTDTRLSGISQTFLGGGFVENAWRIDAAINGLPSGP